MELKGVPLQDAVETLAKQARLKAVWVAEGNLETMHWAMMESASVSCQSAPISQALGQLLGPQHVAYTILDGRVYLKMADRAPQPERAKTVSFSRYLEFEWREDGRLWKVNAQHLSEAELVEALRKMEQLAKDQEGKGMFGGRWEYPNQTYSEQEAATLKTFRLEGVSTTAIRHFL